METAVKKPDRPPDHITHYGSAFWWHEMIYVGASGQIARMVFVEETGKLRLGDSIWIGPTLSDELRDKYLHWMYGAFEEAILKASDDKSAKS